MSGWTSFSGQASSKRSSSGAYRNVKANRCRRTSKAKAIDPAGADEHWKTAYGALDRIHKAFSARKLKPHTFFIGAAIEAEMAVEIWDMLESGVFENAANLTEDDQIVSLTNWLCGL